MRFSSTRGSVGRAVQLIRAIMSCATPRMYMKKYVQCIDSVVTLQAAEETAAARQVLAAHDAPLELAAAGAHAGAVVT